MTTEWHKKHELNIPVIDAQHKQIVACLNELELSIQKGVEAEDIAEILNRTQQYIVRHFGLEEKYMRDSHYPGLEKQLQAHKYFAGRVTRILREYQTGGVTSELANSLKEELSEWIENHVIGLDVAFGAYYQNYRVEIAGVFKNP